MITGTTINGYYDEWKPLYINEWSIGKMLAPKALFLG